MTLVETIPDACDLASNHSILDSWIDLARSAKKEIMIASFYWTLTEGTQALGGAKGVEVYHELEKAAARGVKLRIAQSAPTDAFPDNDTEYFSLHRIAEVRNVNMSAMFGAGVLHTKFWIVDDQAVYVGSANMDWRSLTQVKELGAVVTNCQTMAEDLRRTFESYWLLAGRTTLPTSWPHRTHTHINMKHPEHSMINGKEGDWFLTASPSEICPPGRDIDIDAIVAMIDEAQDFVNIEVMDYVPVAEFQAEPLYWPKIDDALRRAAWDRAVDVKLLCGNWSNTDPIMPPLLRSLQEVGEAIKAGGMNGSLEVRVLNIPVDPAGSFNYTRVNHAKFMVTDQRSLVTTSNWSADYFLTTGGVSLIVKQAQAVADLLAVFMRDWGSKYAALVPLAGR